MDKNIKLICAVLDYARQHASGRGDVMLTNIPIEGYADDQIDGHILLCADAGYIELGYQVDGRPSIKRMTMTGHNYLAQS